MANYFVRKTGLDSNAGTSAAAAFLTILKAMQTVVAGDNIYIGSGVYRESGLNYTNNGSAGNIITMKGDISGVMTGDPGIVRITASADDNAYTNNNIFTLGGAKSYLTFDSLFMDMAASDAFNANNTNNDFITVQNCWIEWIKGRGINIQGADSVVKNNVIKHILRGGDRAIWCGGGNADVQNNWIEQIMGSGACVGIQVEIKTGKLNATVKNNFVDGIYPDGGSPDCCIFVNVNSIVNAVVNVYNNTMRHVKSGGANAAYGLDIENNVASTVMNIYNNDIRRILSDAGTNNAYAIRIQNAGSTVNGNYNMWSDCRDGNSNYTTGANDKAANAVNIIVPPLPMGTTGYKHGHFLSPLSGGYDAGTVTNAPTTDIGNEPRPGSFGQDIGAFEKQGKIEKDTVIYDVTPSTKINGAGYRDFKIAVNSGKVYTITARVTRDTNYGAGTQPSLTVLANGVGMSGTISFTGTAATFQTITIPTTSMTASADGVITIRFQTYSTVAGAGAWIDQITVAEA